MRRIRRGRIDRGRKQSNQEEPFFITEEIAAEMIAAKAADTIERWVQAIVPGFTPAGFLAVQPEVLRAAGLSSAKTHICTT